MKKLQLLAIILTLLPGIRQVAADEIRVAVASNFTAAIKHISERFQKDTGHTITLIFGSTGKHYAQIKNGAPFDAFFAADVKRPALLEQEGVAVPGSRFTYAVGKIILWSPQPGLVDTEANVLKKSDFHHLAIANPKLAPYGQAAREVLQAYGVWEQLQDRLVRGENIEQCYQFVESGNAELGFVAYAQLKRPDHPLAGSMWIVPQALYTPIEQQAVLLKDHEAARAFMAFAKSARARKIIQDLGYDTP